MIKKIRHAFTMLELVFVIVIVGLLSTFGVEFMVQSYKSYIFSAVNNKLQNESATTIEFIAKRLSYRVKGSTIARYTPLNVTTNFDSIGDIDDTRAYRVLEWVGSDVDGFRGISNPLWSGIIDLDFDLNNPNLRLISQETNTSAMNLFIGSLSYGNSDINDSSLLFIGSDSDVALDYGWSGNVNYIHDHNGSIHPINNDTSVSRFMPKPVGAMPQDFTGVDVYEYYQHAWTSYAVVHTADGNLSLHYDYQPWNGDTYLLQADGNQTKRELIMQNVATFKYKAIGSLIKIQVCTESELMEYALCKEKTIY